MWRNERECVIYYIHLSSDSKSCISSDGFNEYDRGSCYKIISERKKFSDAESACRDGGGHLVTIQDEAENQFLLTITSSYVTYKIYFEKKIFFEHFSKIYSVNFQVAMNTESDGFVQFLLYSYSQWHICIFLIRTHMYECHICFFFPANSILVSHLVWLERKGLELSFILNG